MTFDEFQKIAAAKTIVPVYRIINADFLTPVMAYLKLRNTGHFSFLLESAVKGEQLGRYSFIGYAPVKNLRSSQSQTFISNHRNFHHQKNNFFEVLQKELQQYRLISPEPLPRFTCGAVGFIGYDMIREIEHLPPFKSDTLHLPDAVMGFYHDLIAFDHLKNEVILIANVFIDDLNDLPGLYQNAQRRLSDMRTKLAHPLPELPAFSADMNRFSGNFTRPDFESAVERAREYIFAGDIFQVVLSQRFQVPFQGDIFQVYRALRNINPSPYMFYLDFIDYQLIGSSPEPLIRVENGTAEIIPIAGTRPRGESPQEDARHAESLLDDEKEVAEHVMLVDLARNDMGRVSRYGTVQVSDFRTIEKYSHVMHIISRVNGQLAPGYDAVDAFKAAFPAGTVSGAPKIRAMEIIHELEPHRRHFYAGAIGYFDYNGNMDMCLAIRTMLATDGIIYLQAGAGIVADSQPRREYEETLNKAMALKKAIQTAAGGIDDFVYR